MTNIDIYTHFFPPAYGKEIMKRATRSHPDVPNIEMLMRFFPNLVRVRHAFGAHGQV